jgi:inner membrane protein YidH
MNWRSILNRRERKKIKKDLKVQEKQNIEVRDQLAMERTELANERTLLAYSRTAMALVLAGLSFIKFFEDPVYKTIGAGFIPIGIIIGIVGYRRYCKKQERIQHHTRTYVPTSPVHAEVAAQEKADPEPEPEQSSRNTPLA